MFIGEHRNGGIRRAFLEKINGRYQGAAFRFTQGLSCGANALRWGPDGALYLGGTGGDGNWKWRETTFGLERLKPNGTNAFEIQTLRATQGGFLMTMTKPVAASILEDPGNYLPIATASYPNPSYEYGEGRVDGPNLSVTATQALPDGRSVRLTIPDIAPETVLHLRLGSAFETTDGEPLWSGEAYYTMNSLPSTSESQWAEWVTVHFTGSADLSTIGPDADPDADGRINQLEFDEGTNPGVFDATSPGDATAKLISVSFDSDRTLTLRSRELITFSPPSLPGWETSDDLTAWTDVTASVELINEEPVSSTHTVRTFRYIVPVGEMRLFIRRTVSTSEP